MGRSTAVDSKLTGISHAAIRAAVHSRMRIGGTAMARDGDAAPAEARLLVVDDEPNILELLSASLRFAGFEVATAPEGQQALKLVESFQPDLVVLDVMMPGIDGFEVMRRMRERQQLVPVLFLTAR